MRVGGRYGRLGRCNAKSRGFFGFLSPSPPFPAALRHSAMLPSPGTPPRAIFRAAARLPRVRRVPVATRRWKSLNKILSASQLSAFDRSLYLSIRAFQLSRLGREADSRKDIAEMDKVLPAEWRWCCRLPCRAWPGVVIALRRFGPRQRAGPQARRSAADGRTGPDLHADRRLPAGDRAARRCRGRRPGTTANAARRYIFEAMPTSISATMPGGRGLRRLIERPARPSGQGISPLLWRYAARFAPSAMRVPPSRRRRAPKLNEWPGPIVRFLLGKGSSGELEVVAENGRGRQARRRQLSGGLLHRHGRPASRRQAEGTRAVPACPGALFYSL